MFLWWDSAVLRVHFSRSLSTATDTTSLELRTRYVRYVSEKHMMVVGEETLPMKANTRIRVSTFSSVLL